MEGRRGLSSTHGYRRHTLRPGGREGWQMMIEREAIDYLRNDDLAKGVGMVVDSPFPLVVGAPSILI